MPELREGECNVAVTVSALFHDKHFPVCAAERSPGKTGLLP